MDKEEFHKRLHPAISHINASDNMSEETLEAINIMVEKVTKMSTEEIKRMVRNNRKPDSVKDAQRYMYSCEGDMGFMGSPDYYEARKIVDDWNQANPQ